MKQTPLHACHLAAQAKMAEFAGYDMPINYGLGILKEHMWTRENAGLFDVSHMGQAILQGENALAMLEKITPSTFSTLAVNKAKYTVLLTPPLSSPLSGGKEGGGIIDDLIITKLADDKFFVVYNAGCKAKDEAFFRTHLPAGCSFTPLSERALLALQGPAALEIATQTFPAAKLHDLAYMTLTESSFAGNAVFISRLGYTGEDGFEISVAAADAANLWNKILSNELAQPIGLGARDTLRLEMGYPLYGHDIDEQTTPIEADLAWVVAKDRRAEFAPIRKKRVGFDILGRGVIREGARIFRLDGSEIGAITSGGFGPTVGNSIAQGYVLPEFSISGTEVEIELRGNKVPAKVRSYNYVKARTKN